MLATVLTCALVCSPLLRYLDPLWMKGLPNHTLIKLDGIALGSLLALGLYTLALSRRTWLWIGLGAFVLGIAAAATFAGGTAFLDSALALGFTGAVLALMASTGARNPVNAALRRGPLAFYGRISYGLCGRQRLELRYRAWQRGCLQPDLELEQRPVRMTLMYKTILLQIGRASCRERV